MRGHSGGYPGFGARIEWDAGSGVGAIALESATYAAPSVPVREAFDRVFGADPVAPQPLPDAGSAPWPETLAAADAVRAALLHQDATTCIDEGCRNHQHCRPKALILAHSPSFVKQGKLDRRQWHAIGPVPMRSARRSWRVEALTLAELKTLRAVERWPARRPRSARFDGYFEVATLDELLLLLAEESRARGRRIGLNAELKPVEDHAAGERLEDAVLSSLRRGGGDPRLQ